jgi:hypothetical protein
MSALQRVSGYVTVNVLVLVAVPDAVVTAICPVVAPVGTFTTILVAVLELMTAAVPLKVTLVAPARFFPVIVTLVPTAPDAGLNFDTFGATLLVTMIVPCIATYPWIMQ